MAFVKNMYGSSTIALTTNNFKFYLFLKKAELQKRAWEREQFYLLVLSPKS